GGTGRAGSKRRRPPCSRAGWEVHLAQVGGAKMSTRNVVQMAVGVAALLVGIVYLLSNVGAAQTELLPLLAALWPVLVVAFGLFLIWGTRPWRSGARQIDQMIGKLDVRPDNWEM